MVNVFIVVTNII